jgi:cytochrome c biogenesis protein CcmG/thiol:disulfide interchange protein DsbE
VRARSIIVLTAVLALVGLLAYGLTSKGGNALAVGERAPDGRLERLGSDATASISDFRGRWTLLNFWASWCQPCRAEAPVLERFWRDHRGRGVTVVGIDLDDTTDDALRFVKEFGLTYPQLRSPDGARWRDDYGMTGFPESFLLDPAGHLAVIRRGPLDQRAIREQIEPAITVRPGPSGAS